MPSKRPRFESCQKIMLQIHLLNRRQILIKYMKRDVGDAVVGEVNHFQVQLIAEEFQGQSLQKVVRDVEVLHVSQRYKHLARQLFN